MAQDQDRWPVQNTMAQTHDESANYINTSRSSLLLSNRRTTMLFGDRTQPPAENPNNSPELNAQRKCELETVQNLNRAIETSIQHAEETTDKIKQLAQTVDQTDKLLDLWTKILSQAEHTKRLLEDPNWQGMDMCRLRLRSYDDQDMVMAQKEEDSERLMKDEEKERAKGDYKKERRRKKKRDDTHFS
ncbi:hypothetical protein DFQ28_003025 [Apophysomyces sp. BC1034]|nr:hypothetical protein DFQ30_006973 [Apophysomyces sp. BC1015]KAG0179315.1 hypothetical protein DFQ29_002259 [Apophysomyces sp. BC1021]KAG0189745.1 hypothetical protein DFQ28_003025 [Apophysomyces sp. BC1034]